MFDLAREVEYLSGKAISPRKLQEELQKISCSPELHPAVTYRDLFQMMLRRGMVTESDGLLVVKTPA